MSGRVFKVCGCREPRNPETGKPGKQLGARCPKLGTKGHGKWYYTVDVSKDGKRKQDKRGGFRTKKEAEEALEVVRGNTKTGLRIDRKQTVGRELDSYLKEKTTASGISAAGKSIRPATKDVYQLHIGYLKQHLGHILLTELTAEDISEAYRTILGASAEKAAEHERRQAALDELNARKGLPLTKLRPLRVPGITTIRRMHAVLRACMPSSGRA